MIQVFGDGYKPTRKNTMLYQPVRHRRHGHRRVSRNERKARKANWTEATVRLAKTR